MSSTLSNAIEGLYGGGAETGIDLDYLSVSPNSSPYPFCMGPWRSHLKGLSLSFLICKVGIVVLQ